MQTISDALEIGQQLLQSNSDSARLDAELLLSAVMGQPRTHLFAWPEKALTAETITSFKKLLTRRLQGQPVAYITGQREFWSLSLRVNAATLIPRPDTELLVEHALIAIAAKKSPKVLDLGTGSGAIACAIASEHRELDITATDQSPDALDVAKKNARYHQFDNITFLNGDWFSAVKGKHFDVIAANPPYIAEDDPHLSQADIAAEPLSALVSKNNGLSDLHEIIEQAPSYLTRRGVLLVEHGYQQAKEVTAFFSTAGFSMVTSQRDLAGHQRITMGTLDD